MKTIRDIVRGYRAFQEKSGAEARQHFETLAREGQAPKFMIIGCCDSRVEPAAIFGAKPGDMFVLRNVANLVPPPENEGKYHGTSAALEFAVSGLEVKHIIVLGHAQCGGIQACLQERTHGHAPFSYISNWMSILNDVVDKVLENHKGEPAEALQTRLEKEAILASLENLRNFPFIAERLQTKSLQIHGAYFDIAEAKLYGLDQENGEFRLIE